MIKNKLNIIVLKSTLLVLYFSLCIAHSTQRIKDLPKTPIIIDTDMGFDDWLALLYVAKKKSKITCCYYRLFW